MNNKIECKKSRSSRLWKIFWRCNYAILIFLPILLLTMYYAVKIEPERLTVREITFEHAQITDALDGTVIAFISDIHYSPRRIELLNKALKGIKQRQVDVLLIGGDSVNGAGRRRQFNMHDVLKNFSDLSIPGGIYAVLGNHEYRKDLQVNCDAFNDYPVKLLMDQAEIITNDRGGEFNLIGMDYAPNPHRRQDVRRSGKLIQPGLLNIVLTHTPEDFPFLDKRAPLVLTGHTHGGQIHIPGLGSLIRTPWYDRKYARGIIEENGSIKVITTGLGSAYTEARFFTPPEIIFITLKRLSKK